MSVWINSTVAFASHGACLELRPATLLMKSIHETLVLGLKKYDKDPEQMELLVRELILAWRPELEGCVIEAMSFDLPRCCWFFVVSHRSLPKREWGSEATVLPLIPEESPSVTLTKDA